MSNHNPWRLAAELYPFLSSGTSTPVEVTDGIVREVFAVMEEPSEAALSKARRWANSHDIDVFAISDADFRDLYRAILAQAKEEVMGMRGPFPSLEERRARIMEAITPDNMREDQARRPWWARVRA